MKGLEEHPSQKAVLDLPPQKFFTQDKPNTKNCFIKETWSEWRRGKPVPARSYWTPSWRPLLWWINFKVNWFCKGLLRLLSLEFVSISQTGLHGGANFWHCALKFTCGTQVWSGHYPLLKGHNLSFEAFRHNILKFHWMVLNTLWWETIGFTVSLDFTLVEHFFLTV